MSERTHSRRSAPLGDIYNLTDPLIPESADEYTAPRQADVVQEGRGPAGADREEPASHADPPQADAVQEGRGPAGEEPDRVQELFRLLKRAMEDQTDPAAVARTFRARQDAQLLEVAFEIEQLERNNATTIRELRESLVAVQRSINRAIEESQGEQTLSDALAAYRRIKERFWERLVNAISADLEQITIQLRGEVRTVEVEFRKEIAALRSGTGAARRARRRERLDRNMWRLAAALIFCMAVAGAWIAFDHF